MFRASPRRTLACPGWTSRRRPPGGGAPPAAASPLRGARERGSPCFVKPSNLGSSVGISKVREAGELAAAVEAAFAHDRKILVERGVTGREGEGGVLGNDPPEASGPG